jgi:hypothetical protein
LTSFQPEKPQEKRQKNYQVQGFILPVPGLPEIPDKADGKKGHQQIIKKSY